MAITGELADLAEATIGEATRVLFNARRHRQGEGAAGRLQAAVIELDTIMDRAGRVIAQTRARLCGITPAAATRLVSLHDPDARPIAKGRLGTPVKFGYKAQFSDNTDGIVLDYSAHEGNPADAPPLAPAIAWVKAVFAKVPGAVTADRGYGQAKTDEALAALGAKTVVIPRKGKPLAARRAVEHGQRFRRLVKWRTGSEGPIFYLKRRYGLERTLLDGLTGARAWVRAGCAGPQQCPDRRARRGPPRRHRHRGHRHHRCPRARPQRQGHDWAAGPAAAHP